MTVALARRTWAALFAMIALITSLVGMHSVAMPMEMEMPSGITAPMSADMPLAAATSTSATTLTTAPDLGAMTMPAVSEAQLAVSQASESLRGLGDMTMAMSCAMALLALALALLLGRSRVIVTALDPIDTSSSAIWPSRSRPAHPPSLVELSISRT